MKLKYDKVNWTNGVTKVNSTNLNNMDNGIENATNAINELDAFKNNIESIIPIQVSETNQLADKDYVKSSIAESAATFRGTYTSVEDLPTEGVDENDYVWVDITDEFGNRKFDRYIFTNGNWSYEYTLNNSNFNDKQWAAINSGANKELINKILINEANIKSLDNNKQDKLNDNTLDINVATLSAKKIGLKYTNEDGTQTTGKWDSNLVPNIDDQYDLGSKDKKWNDIYSNEIHANKFKIGQGPFAETDFDTLLIKNPNTYKSVLKHSNLRTVLCHNDIEVFESNDTDTNIKDYGTNRSILRAANPNGTITIGNSNMSIYQDGVINIVPDCNATGESIDLNSYNRIKIGGQEPIIKYGDPVDAIFSYKMANSKFEVTSFIITKNNIVRINAWDNNDEYETKYSSLISDPNSLSLTLETVYTNLENIDVSSLTLKNGNLNIEERFTNYDYNINTKADFNKEGFKLSQYYINNNESYETNSIFKITGEGLHFSVNDNNLKLLRSGFYYNDSEVVNKNYTGNIDNLETTNKNSLVEAINNVNSDLNNKIDKVEGKSLIDNDKIEKLDNISNNANKVEKSDINGNIKIDGTETIVYTLPESIPDDINTISNNLINLNKKIPIQASESNQLADKDYVNSSIATSTATFRGTYTNVGDFPSDIADDNDYIWYDTTDEFGNRKFDKYKYSNNSWIYEYTLNNSSFTSDQWKAINSNATSEAIAKIAINENNITLLDNNKLDKTSFNEFKNQNDNILSTKVDKIEGKGLSSNDFTNFHKEKVETIGTLTDLDTTDKTSIVNAINEVNIDIKNKFKYGITNSEYSVVKINNGVAVEAGRLIEIAENEGDSPSELLIAGGLFFEKIN